MTRFDARMIIRDGPVFGRVERLVRELVMSRASLTMFEEVDKHARAYVDVEVQRRLFQVHRAMKRVERDEE